MRKAGMQFRFPIPGISFMSLTFALVVLVIHETRKAALALAGSSYVVNGHVYLYQPERASFLQTIGFAFAVTFVVSVVVWAVLFVMQKAGIHRLAAVETWPQSR